MTKTEDKILDACEALMQERGYHGFSFADIAEQVGIRKASIYYYFPAKADLGQRTVQRYRDTMRMARQDWDREDNPDIPSAYQTYMQPILELGRKPQTSCLCGVLGGEYHSLPPSVQQEVSDFFEEHLRTLRQLLEIGRDTGFFRFDGDPAVIAKVAFSLIEGSMLLKRSCQDAEVFDTAVVNLEKLLGVQS